MYNKLLKINQKPNPFEFYTAAELWADEHTSKHMLAYHLDEHIDAASRNKAFIEESVQWIMKHFKLGRDSSLFDFGCGPGLYTTRFARAGLDVTGIDFSERSINYARGTVQKEQLAVRYIHQNYLEYEPDCMVDLVTMIWCDYCALSPDQRKLLLRKFKNLLKPGGKILLDVHSLNAFNDIEESCRYERNHMGNFWSPNDHFCFINTWKYEKEKVGLHKYTIIEKDRQKIVYNWLQYFSPECLKKEFEENGLVIEEMYQDVCGNPYNPGARDIAVVARSS